MVDVSVNATTPSSKDFSSLAQIFATSLQYYCKNVSPLGSDYIARLNTIAELSLAAAVAAADSSFLSIYQSCLSIFLSNIPLKEKTSDTRALSLAVVKMIEGAVSSFRRIRRPDYYPSFVSAVKETVIQVRVHDPGKEEEARRLLKVLFGRGVSFAL